MSGLVLYDLSEAYRNILNLIDEENPDTELTNALAAIEGQIEVKAVNIANLIKYLEAEADMIEAEERRLAQRKKSRENSVKQIKSYLQNNLEAVGMDKIITPTRTVYIQKNPPSVEILDIEKVPQKFLTYIPAKYEARKKDIMSAWKEGEEIPGVSVTQGRSVRIK